ncbi:hypothetical protein B0T17DRAFT_5458 [Bombardia bombarda]|uniref:Uncharacterized protein n=1 Tax=Bombardia bombarda TaxID=252184 RepID=A0AA40CD47_9PEZI|nr:hypothetical protein B0T17DRAFT_5458 [Bombardia bombarda]
MANRSSVSPTSAWSSLSLILLPATRQIDWNLPDTGPMFVHHDQFPDAPILGPTKATLHKHTHSRKSQLPAYLPYPAESACLEPPSRLHANYRFLRPAPWEGGGNIQVENSAPHPIHQTKKKNGAIPTKNSLVE